MQTEFSRALGIELPLICGAMYPCSNPELVAAVSAAGGIGIVQPLSLTYVHGYDFRAGLRYIRSLTHKPALRDVFLDLLQNELLHAGVGVLIARCVRVDDTFEGGVFVEERLTAGGVLLSGFRQEIIGRVEEPAASWPPPARGRWPSCIW